MGRRLFGLSVYQHGFADKSDPNTPYGDSICGLDRYRCGGNCLDGDFCLSRTGPFLATFLHHDTHHLDHRTEIRIALIVGSILHNGSTRMNNFSIKKRHNGGKIRQFRNK